MPVGRITRGHVRRFVQSVFGGRSCGGRTLDTKRLADSIYRSDIVRRCLVCRAPSTALAVFIPDKPWNFGGAYTPGKQRRIVYGCCNACIGKAEEVERAMEELA